MFRQKKKVGSGLIGLIYIFERVFVLVMRALHKNSGYFFIINQGKHACLDNDKSAIAHVLLSQLSAI
jgi:hypothetical protein